MNMLLQAVSTSTSTGTTVSSTALILLEVIVVVGSIAIFGTVFSRLLSSLAVRAGAPKSIVGTIRQWVAVLMILAGGAAVATLTGISSEFTALTLSGVAGLAITLALQNTLSNIISGVLLLQDGVLRLGDDIEFGSVRGEVVKLNLRTTWLRSKDGVIVVIGNSNLSAGPIVNRTAVARLEKRMQI